MNKTKYKDFYISIEADDHPQSPREFSNVGTMICGHRRYTLGDSHDFNLRDYNSWEDLRKVITKQYRNNIILPIYMYDHSGVTVSTTPFNCRWDSGQVGFIIVDRDKVKECMGWKVITAKRKEKLYEYLKGEVDTYNTFLSGEIVGYRITDSEGEDIDSCWGYYDTDYAMTEAKATVDNY